MNKPTGGSSATQNELKRATDSTFKEAYTSTGADLMHLKLKQGSGHSPDENPNGPAMLLEAARKDLENN